MMRSLTMVPAPANIIAHSTSTCESVSSQRSSTPAASLPIMPATAAFPPSARTLHATLLAPPGMLLSLATFTTGTGASGEIRVTDP